MAVRVSNLRLTLTSMAHDPGHTSLRRGLRAAIIVPVLLGAATLLAFGPAPTTFLVFGVMALLVFADFGGTSRSRVSAYVLATLAGIPLVVIGTLASTSLWIAVAASLLAGVVLSGLGVLGGYFLNSQTPLLLAFVLAVTSAASADAIPGRVIGWAAGGAIAALAGWLVWPRSSHVALRGAAASVVRVVAATIDAPAERNAVGATTTLPSDSGAADDFGRSDAQRQGDSRAEASRLEAAARQELAALNRGFVSAQRRPSGATRRDRALAELATELDRALTFAAQAASTQTVAAAHEVARLRECVVRALQASADLLEGGRDAHDIAPLEQARDAHRAALDRWVAEQLQAGAAPEFVLDELTAAHPMRLMSNMVLLIARNAEVVAGLPPTGPSPAASRRSVWSTFVEEFTPSSIWLRNSLRTGVAIALAVLVARALAVPYAFWVVLGTLSALRGNISATGRTAFIALGGTALGVLIAVPFVGVTGTQPWILWIVFPLLVFLAAYTPAAVSFLIGQVAFSVLVVVLFNILAPADWQLGLLRVENVAIGLIISVGVGLLLWPRGAKGQLRSALADLYDAGASLLSFSFRRVLIDDAESAIGASANPQDESRRTMERPATPASMRNDAEQPRSDKGAASEEPATPASMRNEAAQPAAEMRTTPQDASGAASEEPSSLDGVASGAARPTAEMATQSPGHGGAASDQSSIPSVLGQRRKATAAQHTAESMGELDAVRNAAVTAAIRAQEVFEQFLTDRSKQAPSIEVWALLLASGKGLVLISDVMDWLFKHGYSAAPTGASGNTVGGIANDTIANILRLAEEIRTGRPLRVAGLHDAAPELRSASLAGLSQPGLAESPEALRAAIGLASVVDWLLQLENLLRDLEKPVAETLAVNTAARRR